MVKVTGDGSKLGHSYTVLRVKVILRPLSGASVNDEARSAEMAEIHRMLGQWLDEKCDDKARQSMFVQNDYAVSIAVTEL